MKSDHRHELKSNELADWLANLPEWAQQNRTTLLATAAIIVVAAIVYFWSFYRSHVVSVRNQERLTLLATQVPQRINQAISAAAQNGDQSLGLAPLAEDLQDFADSESNNNMAALALIKRGEAIRAELHLRSTPVSANELTSQIEQAQASYQTALDRKPTNQGLAASAQFGLGLCQEELGNFDKAAEIYREVVQKPEYKGTVAQAAAEYRLKIMDDFKSPVAFKPAPPEPKAPVTSQATVPTLQINPSDANATTVVPMPTVEPAPAEANSTPAPAIPPAPVEANKPAGGQ